MAAPAGLTGVGMRDRHGASATISGFAGVGLLAWRLANALRLGPILYPDTTDYLAVQGNLVERWAADRPLGLPLLLDAVPSSTWLFVIHAFVGALAWALLLHVVLSTVRTRAGQVSATVVLLWAATSVRVTAWDAAVLTESLSVSLLVTVVALGLLWAHRPRPATAAAWVIVALLWASLRDVNAAEVALGGSLCLVVALVLRTRRGRVDAQLVVVGAAGLAVATLLLGGAAAGHRGEYPLYNVIGARVLVDEVATDHFVRAGMPVSDDLLALRGRLAFEGFMDDPDLTDFRAWARQHGQAVWAGFLVTHPRWTADHLVDSAQHALFLPLGHYGGQPDATLLRRLAVPDSLPAVAVWTSLAVGLLAVPRAGDRLRLAAGLALALGAVDLGMAWAADAIEQSRHALSSTVLLGLAVALQAGPVTDRAAEAVATHRRG